MLPIYMNKRGSGLLGQPSGSQGCSLGYEPRADIFIIAQVTNGAEVPF